MMFDLFVSDFKRSLHYHISSLSSLMRASHSSSRRSTSSAPDTSLSHTPPPYQQFHQPSTPRSDRYHNLSFTSSTKSSSSSSASPSLRNRTATDSLNTTTSTIPLNPTRSGTGSRIAQHIVDDDDNNDFIDYEIDETIHPTSSMTSYPVFHSTPHTLNVSKSHSTTSDQQVKKRTTSGSTKATKTERRIHPGSVSGSILTSATKSLKSGLSPSIVEDGDLIDDDDDEADPEKKALVEENFNLKMRIFHLEQEVTKLKQLQESIPAQIDRNDENDANEKEAMMIELHNLNDQLIRVNEDLDWKNEKIQEKDSLLAQYETNMVNLTQENDGLKIELEASREQITTLRNQLEQLEFESAKEIERKNKIIADSENQKNELSDQHKKLKDSIQKLENREEELIQENRELSKQVSKLQPLSRDAEEYKVMNDRKDAEIRELRERLLMMTATSAATSASTFTSQSSLNPLPSTFSLSSSAVTALESTISELRRQIRVLQEQNNELQNSKVILEASIVAANANASFRSSNTSAASSSSFLSAASASAAAAVAFDEERRVYERRVQGANEAVKDAMARLEKSNKIIDELEIKLRESSAKALEFEYAYKDSQHDLDHLKTRYKVESDEHAKNIRSLQEYYQEHVDDAERRILEASKEWKATVVDLKRKLEEQARKLQEAEVKNAQLMIASKISSQPGESDIDVLASELKNLQSEIQKHKQINEKLEAENLTAIQECQTYKVKVKVLEEDVKSLNSELTTLSKKIKESRQDEKHNSSFPIVFVNTIQDIADEIATLVRRNDANMNTFLRISEISKQKISISELEIIRQNVNQLLESNVKLGAQLQILQEEIETFENINQTKR